MTAPVQGQTVIVKIASSPVRTVPALVTLVTDADTVTAVGQIDINDDWPSDGPGETHPCYPFFSITRGSGLNQWQEAAVPVPTNVAIATAVSGLATEAYADNAQAQCQALPAAGSTVSLALNTPRRPSVTRPVKVTVSGDWAWVLNAVGSQSGVCTMQSDASATPSTARARATCARGIGAGITVNDTGTTPWHMTYEVPTGHYYTLATSGTGTFGAAPLVTEQVL